MRKNNTNNLIEDLIVTGGHGVLVDELSLAAKDKYTELNVFNELEKIDDKYVLLASAAACFKQLKDYKFMEYYNFVCENNGDVKARYGVWANGVLMETPSEEYYISARYKDLL
jgi:hypothetical protein